LGEWILEYCKKYCNSDLEKSIANGIAILFHQVFAIAIAILFASIASNPGCNNNYSKCLANDPPFKVYREHSPSRLTVITTESETMLQPVEKPTVFRDRIMQ